jgi:hypothetical protein
MPALKSCWMNSTEQRRSLTDATIFVCFMLLRFLTSAKLQTFYERKKDYPGKVFTLPAFIRAHPITPHGTFPYILQKTLHPASRRHILK